MIPTKPWVLATCAPQLRPRPTPYQPTRTRLRPAPHQYHRPATRMNPSKLLVVAAQPPRTPTPSPHIPRGSMTYVTARPGAQPGGHASSKQRERARAPNSARPQTTTTTRQHDLYGHRDGARGCHWHDSATTDNNTPRRRTWVPQAQQRYTHFTHHTFDKARGGGTADPWGQLGGMGGPLTPLITLGDTCVLVVV